MALSDEEEAELDALLEPAGWEPPDSLDAFQVLALFANPDKTGAEILGTQAAISEEFCAAHKGDHSFADGANQCRCGRALPASSQAMRTQSECPTCPHGWHGLPCHHRPFTGSCECPSSWVDPESTNR